MSGKLQTPIDYLKGVGPNRADLLRKELGIHTYQDLINLFPNRYIDRRNSIHHMWLLGRLTGLVENSIWRTQS